MPNSRKTRSADSGAAKARPQGSGPKADAGKRVAKSSAKTAGKSTAKAGSSKAKAKNSRAKAKRMPAKANNGNEEARSRIANEGSGAKATSTRTQPKADAGRIEQSTATNRKARRRTGATGHSRVGEPPPKKGPTVANVDPAAINSRAVKLVGV